MQCLTRVLLLQDGDAVVIFNFRSDRVVELSKALEYDDFSSFDRCGHLYSNVPVLVTPDSRQHA
jgi:bisphosphoglycerate-independent phosphoglycerate mutase (AlkP superfamily)